MGRRVLPTDAGDMARLVGELETQRLELDAQQAELAQQHATLDIQNEELRQAQHEAMAARDHYAKIFESAPIGYFTLDLDGRVSAINAAGAALLGRQRGEIVDRKLVSFVAPDAAQACRGFLARMALPDGTEACTVPLVRPDGGQPVVRFEGRIDSAGTEFLVAALDVTEHSRAAAALDAAREAAERASRAKSAFLANMSHEMRTPLHIIVGLGHLLRRDLDDTAQQQRLEQLCANSDHLLDLINDVLDLSRIEAGRLALDRRPFRLADVVSRVLGVIATPARSKGLELSVEVDDAMREAALLGDPLRLAQVLINLGNNAVKFTEWGSVRLVVECLGETAEGLQLRFAVHDTGIGIAPADQRHLFEVFSQADNSPTRAHGGSGLGLAISQRLVGMMGGHIDVDSRAGSGSLFSFQLVLPRGDAVADEPAGPPAAAHLGGRRVMFAEDHPLSQEILFEMLEDLGCEVDVASDGVEAVECAKQRDYDLILMDMQMPKMDGLAATRAIRALPRHRDTPIIALTANAFAEDRQRCFDAGMNDHLGKPVTPDTLGNALGRWLPALAQREIDAKAGAAEAEALGISGIQPPSSLRGSPQRLAEFRALLARFAHLHGHDMAVIGQNLADGRRDEAHRVAHDLKGIAGLIGARSIARLAGEIVVGLRAGSEPAALQSTIDACARELEQLVAAVAGLDAQA
ncbi:MAG: response regulator [Ignavibacteria bacterium]